jgi:hypothetical protein
MVWRMINGKPVWISAGNKIQSWNYYNRTGLNFVPSPESKMTEWKHIPKIRISEKTLMSQEDIADLLKKGTITRDERQKLMMNRAKEMGDIIRAEKEANRRRKLKNR